jgi:hypothetical protein
VPFEQVRQRHRSDFVDQTFLERGFNCRGVVSAWPGATAITPPVTRSLIRGAMLLHNATRQVSFDSVERAA